MVYGIWYMVYGLGFSVQGLGFTVKLICSGLQSYFDGYGVNLRNS